MPSESSLSSSDTIDLFQQYVIPNYGRYPVSLVRGEGSYVWDAEGNRYLDFFPGWGCNLLGHCPPPVVQAVQEQVAKLIHVPIPGISKPKDGGPRSSASTVLEARPFSVIPERKPTRPRLNWFGSTRPKTATRSSPLKAASMGEPSVPLPQRPNRSITKGLDLSWQDSCTPPSVISKLWKL